ncbi:hypothetical protein [Qipengyuania flava]|uniref:hypothetical protein n=1 Tax=Qipengyuania flava TaxID=192812 RepID=UPI001C634C54|nr:hypothetical protein [Qipengyuania flava]QYJ07658.1 hypothetical protein KUV82_02750 [Qipengyuania flava]
MPARIIVLGRETWDAIAELFANLAWRRVAFFLLPYAGVLLGLDVAAHYGAVTDAPLPAQFFISKDEGFGEYLEYALLAATAVMLALMWRRTRAGIYLVNALLFAYLTADDSLQIHERFGHMVAPAMPQGTPLPPNDFGEVLLFGLVGVTWLVSLLVALRRADLRPATHALILAVGVVGAGFFGILADAATSWGDKSRALIEFHAWFEDGGEFLMIIATFLAAVAIFDTERRRPTTGGSAAS